MRLWAGFLAQGLRRYAAGVGRRPLLVVLDCKGGADSRRVADRARRVLRGAGARSTAIWPDEASLSLWALPARQLTTTLVDMIEHGTGGAAYYSDVLEAVIALAVGPPCGPPASTAGFLARLDAGWLAAAYASAPGGKDAALLRSASRHISDIALRFRTLFRRLGEGLDGPGGFGDADAWYCILEGTSEIAVAEAQARALVDILASYITHLPARARGRVMGSPGFVPDPRRTGRRPGPHPPPRHRAGRLHLPRRRDVHPDQTTHRHTPRTARPTGRGLAATRRPGARRPPRPGGRNRAPPSPAPAGHGRGNAPARRRDPAGRGVRQRAGLNHETAAPPDPLPRAPTRKAAAPCQLAALRPEHQPRRVEPAQDLGEPVCGGLDGVRGRLASWQGRM